MLRSPIDRDVTAATKRSSSPGHCRSGLTPVLLYLT
jgi:hypothetical protein